jgi:hypothetical protein
LKRSGTWVYVYAVLERPTPSAVEGIDGRPIRWITHNGLVAAVSDVREEDFSEEALNANVRDMGWLGPRAITHQEVNSKLHDEAETIIPLAFGTVFRDDARVRHMLDRQGRAMKARLDAVRGCAEWVVALHLLQEHDVEAVANASTAVQAARAEIAASSPGRAHLLRRRLAELERDEARRLQFEAAAQVIDSLTTVARDVYPEPLPTETLERPLLRASVLVPRQDEPSFLDTVDGLRVTWPEPTYRLLLTGPWPPYRFGGLNDRDGG